MVAVAAILEQPETGAAQVPSVGPATGRPGVRHQVLASLRPAPDFPGSRKGAAPAMLKLSFLISSHALESRFFGIAAADFRTEDLAAGGPEVVVWEDVRCHTARGLPKVSLVAVQGSVTQEGGDFPVWALLRQRGRRLPPDEIIQRKDLGDASGAWLAITATTTATRLQVSIKLLARPCPLESP